MYVYRGEYISPDAGAPSLFTIGVSLARVARFCGHTRQYYTVLPHVLSVAALLPPEEGLGGLMHDTPEVCVGDVPTPMKTQAAVDREDVLLRRWYDHFGLAWPSEEAQARLKEADTKMLVAEASVLGYHKNMLEWVSEMYHEPDPQAMYLVERYIPKAELWATRPDLSGRVFERAFARYRALAEAPPRRGTGPVPRGALSAVPA
jgi:hypothetical protein